MKKVFFLTLLLCASCWAGGRDLARSSDPDTSDFTIESAEPDGVYIIDADDIKAMNSQEVRDLCLAYSLMRGALNSDDFVDALADKLLPGWLVKRERAKRSAKHA